MNPEIKKKWVDALRSGNYHQGRYRLRKEDKFCCIGVLCDIVDNVRWRINSQSLWFFGNEHFSLPGDLKYNGEPLLDVSIEKQLTTMNDDRGLTFSQIADYVEKNV